jgi:ribosomal protein S18 acetylase RimI-like enzyme
MSTRLLEVTVTYLERPVGLSVPEVAPPSLNLRIIHAHNPTVAFYRFLYNTVGEPWLWMERRKMSDSDLAAAVQDPGVQIHVLYDSGVPAGYVELDFRDPEATEIAYLGIMPEFIGRKLGPYLLAWALRKDQRMTVNTCTFDHPKALGLYQRFGFEILRTVTKYVEDPRLTGVIPRHAAPQIPFAG